MLLTIVSEIITTLIIAIITIKFYRKWQKRRRMPPGPIGLPILGNVLLTNQEYFLLNLSKWRRLYGDILSIRLLQTEYVVVSSYDYIKEVLIKQQDAFAGRISDSRWRAVCKSHEDVALSSLSPTWMTKKKAMLFALKMYGEDLSRLEKITLRCIQDTMKTIENTKSKPFNPKQCVHHLIVQILSTLVNGRPFTEEELELLMKAQERLHSKIVSPDPKGLQWFSYWSDYFQNSLSEEVKHVTEVLWKIHGSLVRERKEIFDEDNPECSIDGFLLHQAKERKEQNNPVLSDEVIVCMLTDIFEAGLATTLQNTLALLAILANHPDIQEKVQREIDDVIGNNEPTLLDRRNMHYTSACLLELTRYTSILPLLAPHTAMRDVELRKFLIPEKTRILCNVWEVNHDTNFWEDPWTFMPERFLNKQGHLVDPDHPNRRRILSFGAGRRVCAGEVLAKNRIFLFVTCLLQKFKFFPSHGKLAPKHDPRSYKFGTILMINDYNVVAQPRSVGEY